MKSRIIGPAELRANPSLAVELRERPGEHVELRFAPLASLTLRSTTDGEDPEPREVPLMGGLAAVYGSRSEDLGGFLEVITPGAFAPALDADPDVRFLWNHDPNLLLARTSAGTLGLKDTADGLEYEADPAATTYARDLALLMERGEVTQSSFAFRVAPGGAEWQEDPETGLLLRIVRSIAALYDVSAVTYPAYPAATSGVRAAAADLAAERRSTSAEARERVLRLMAA